MKRPNPLPDLKSLIEFASKNAEKIFAHTSVILPLYHAICADGSHFVVMAPDTDKDTSVGLMKAAFELEDVDRYVFVAEAWTLHCDATETPIPSRLEDHPDRRECVMFSAENRQGQMQTARRYILRPEHSRPKLSPLVLDDMSQIEHSVGRMVGMLRRQA